MMAKAESRESPLAHSQTGRKCCLAANGNEVSGYQVETCSGPGGCPNRAIVCEGLAEEIGNRLKKQGLNAFLKRIVQGPLKTHHEFRISISDCPNACSRPQIADIGLIGACRPMVTGETCNGCGACMESCREDAISFMEGIPIVDSGKCLSCGKCISLCPTGTLRAGGSGYRILLGGKLGRHPRLGTELPGIFNKNEAMDIIDRCVTYYKHHCVAGERLGEIMVKHGGMIDESISKPLAQTDKGSHYRIPQACRYSE